EIFLTNSVNVQKSYWQSPHLKQENIEEALTAGLEQAGDTYRPRLHWRRFFRELVEQDLARLARDTRALLASPADAVTFPLPTTEPTTIVIGPETGFSPDETRTFLEAGFAPCSLGPRILRVETALPALVSRLVPSL
ncbi:MAG TPA: RsmE family RNA methyltransferase, partial [Candidatus Ozemobacteraceae bacterium]|nr:RsmE family RNA methyltransferase [Candidatus Ozemobacteraceae bacterium]